MTNTLRQVAWLGLLTVGLLTVAGCGGSPAETPQPTAAAEKPKAAPKQPSIIAPPPTQIASPTPAATPTQVTSPPAATKVPPPERTIEAPADAAASPGKQTSIVPGAALPRPRADDQEEAKRGAARTPAAPLPDDERVAAAGIRKLVGKHLTLYTDLPSTAAVDELPALFDQAVPQWQSYFGPAPVEQPWRVVGCLMGDKQRFQAAGLLPDDLPEFLHGYYRGDRLWLYEQSSDYYRRHLLLHEGTHAFADAAFGACGPPWYMEGIAELLATHSLEDGHLKLNVFPARREDFPLWGRVKLVRDAIESGRPMTLPDVLDYGATAHRKLDPYGWCWALAAFLDNHPRYQERFRKLPEMVRQAEFNQLFRQLYAEDWEQLAEEWQVFAANLEYGYDFERTPLEFAASKPLPAGGATATVLADRGWQSSGYQLEAGKSYRLTATGQFQLAEKPRPWISEPTGVSIRYSQGKPLGQLLGAIHPASKDSSAQSPLAEPVVIGAGLSLTPTETGALYLRLNDSMAELSDNAGKVEVRIEPE